MKPCHRFLYLGLGSVVCPSARPLSEGWLASSHPYDTRQLWTFVPRSDLVSIMPVCVCPKVKEMGSFSASSE